MSADAVFATIRATTADELPAFKAIIDAVELFPSAMLDDMIAPFFDRVSQTEHWLTADLDGAPAGLAYYVPERMTSGTWNLLLIAVHPNMQGQGIGTRLMRHVETELAAAGERILLVETSGLPSFAATRAFYHSIGYEEEARIRNFYQSGEDKVIFSKSLVQRS